MLKTHKQRASTRKRKNWIQQYTRRGTVAVTYYTEPTVGSALNAETLTQPPEYVRAQVGLHVADALNETAKTPTYAVMVKLMGARCAKRIAGDGTLTTRKDRAQPFRSKAAAQKLADEQMEHDSNVECAWVAKF